MPQTCRHLIAVLRKLRHHLLVQPDVRRNHRASRCNEALSLTNRKWLARTGEPNGKAEVDHRLRRLRYRAAVDRRHATSWRPRPRIPDRYGSTRASLAHGTQARIRRVRGKRRRLFHDPRAGRTRYGHTGFPASALPPRLRFRQHKITHQEGEGSERQSDREHQFSTRGEYLDARHP